MCLDSVNAVRITNMFPIQNDYLDKSDKFHLVKLVHLSRLVVNHEVHFFVEHLLANEIETEMLTTKMTMPEKRVLESNLCLYQIYIMGT